MTATRGAGRDTYSLVDVGRATVATAEDGSTVFDDASSPWVVRVWTQAERGRVRLTRLQVDVRDPRVSITAARLGRLPVGQMLHVAAVAVTTLTAHSNEIYYRMAAVPPIRGGLNNAHWDRVLAAFQWAKDTGRAGGPHKAVADLWGVAQNPTVYRWLKLARQRRG